MKHIKKFEEFVNESVNEATTMAIDNRRLDDYARSIAILCNGEYGSV